MHAKRARKASNQKPKYGSGCQEPGAHQPSQAAVSSLLMPADMPQPLHSSQITQPASTPEQRLHRSLLPASTHGHSELAHILRHCYHTHSDPVPFSGDQLPATSRQLAKKHAFPRKAETRGSALTADFGKSGSGKRKKENNQTKQPQPLIRFYETQTQLQLCSPPQQHATPSCTHTAPTYIPTTSAHIPKATASHAPPWRALLEFALPHFQKASVTYCFQTPC